MNNKPLKSIHITNYYHKNSGGISTAYNHLLEAANRRGRYVRLIVPGEKAEVETVGAFGKIYYVAARLSPLFDKRYRVMLPWKTYIPDKSPIKTILRDERPDIVEIGEKYSLSLMAGLMRKGAMKISDPRPMLVQLSCERMDDNIRSFVSGGALGKWFSRRLMGNYNFPMFDFHLTNSDYTAKELFDAISNEKNPRRSKKFFDLCQHFFDAPRVPASERIFVNQCGVDNVTFTVKRQNAAVRSAILREYDLPETARILLYAGRISPEKNVGLLPDLMKILAADASNDFRLLIAGAGPRADWLTAEAERIGAGKIKMLGHLGDKEKLANLFANADAFVHPNPREPFGITPLEAMASGLPVIAPASGGLLSYANNENAWLVEANAEAFAAAIRDVFSDETRRKNKIENALETAEKYTWESSTDALFAIYDRMFAEFTRRRELYDYKRNDAKTNFSKSEATET